VDRQKKKGIKVYAVILLLTVAIGVISPYLPPTVDSSMSENYGKWTYDIPKFPQRQLSLLPQMEVTNLDEVLVMELQHTATVIPESSGERSRIRDGFASNLRTQKNQTMNKKYFFPALFLDGKGLL